MRNISKIDIVLENCESITLDAKYFGEFLLDKIHTKISRIACNSIAEMNTTDEVAIEIFKDANNIDYRPFGGDEKSNIFDRLTQYNDITSFRLYFEKKTDEKKRRKEKDVEYEFEDIYINWYGDSDNENESQISYISTQGNLYIVIAKDKNIDDFFATEHIEDVEDMDFHRSMIF